MTNQNDNAQLSMTGAHSQPEVTVPRHERRVNTMVMGLAVIALIVAGWRILPTAAIPAPPDFSMYTDTEQRKQMFFEYFLPLVTLRNQQILEQRERLLALSERRGSLMFWQRMWLQQLAEEYEITGFDVASDDDWEILIRRVDIVPPSLALAQAANESAWGGSRFAVEGNNYFGHWCFVAGCGLVPEDRPAGAQHEVAAFDSPLHSVQRYIHNLNSHEAYLDLRRRREALRENDRLVSGLELVGDLDRYSERGDAYIDELSEMIRFNELDDLDVTIEPDSTLD
jgi:Bax protein